MQKTSDGKITYASFDTHVLFWMVGRHIVYEGTEKPTYQDTPDTILLKGPGIDNRVRPIVKILADVIAARLHLDPDTITYKRAQEYIAKYRRASPSTMVRPFAFFLRGGIIGRNRELSPTAIDIAHIVNQPTELLYQQFLSEASARKRPLKKKAIGPRAKRGRNHPDNAIGLQ